MLEIRNPGQDTAEGCSPLTRNVMNFLENAECRRCGDGEDFDAVCRLRYKAYSQVGIAPDLDSGTIEDELDSTPNAHVFGIFIGGRLASTVRLHVLSRENPVSATMNVYRDIMEARLSRGESFIDPSRFASDPEMAGLHRALPYVTLRLAAMACDRFQVTSCLSLVREEHAGFYARVFRSKRVAGPRSTAMITGSAILMESPPRAAYMEDTYGRYPFFRPRPGEISSLFPE